MRILELEIHNVRGIKDIKLCPNGKNLVIWGPNGSGKSAVVDAVDFLLTGKISRLMGEGTAGVSLRDHGPHIDHKPKEAWVSATIQVPGSPLPISLQRTLATPQTLFFPAEHKALLEPIIELAARGQHVLSRREILRYVTAEAGKRAAEVQALLNLSELEDIRKTIGKIANSAKSDLTSAEAALATASSAVQATLGLESSDTVIVLKAINSLRARLGGQPLDGINSDSLKQGITSPALETKSQSINPQILSRVHISLSKSLDNLDTSIVRLDRELRGALEELRKNETALREMSKLKLMEMGIAQISDDGSCPLCGAAWESGLLRKHLESHILSAKAAATTSEKIQSLSSSMSEVASTVQNQIFQITHAAKQLGMDEEAAQLNEWTARLGKFIESLREPLSGYPGVANESSDVAVLFAPRNNPVLIQSVMRQVESTMPPVSAEQLAWDTLTSLRENWKQYENAKTKSTAAKLFHDRARVLDKCFEEARDHVLGSLYASIETRFSDLYKMIHKEDEPQFTTTIRPDGAGLVFKVDFFGRGQFPPLALHSEGHQDTMGLCLYLVLAERLTGKTSALTILDDVVMSVDSGHRRKVCELLASEFSDRQFLITTHDRTWARQLITAGVVSHKNSIEFTRWSLDTGPLITSESMEPSFWKTIDQEIDRGEIPAAAARLRRGAEQFLEQVCDGFGALIRYRSDGRWDFSDFVNGAISAYTKYLREAKAAANTWNDSSVLDVLQEAESVASQIIKRSQVEHWGINENVHYNRWGDFQPEDFRPVAEAWRDLLNIFQCQICGGILFLTTQNYKAASVRCKCGKISWNLLRAEKKTSTGNDQTNS